MPPFAYSLDVPPRRAISLIDQAVEVSAISHLLASPQISPSSGPVARHLGDEDETMITGHRFKIVLIIRELVSGLKVSNRDSSISASSASAVGKASMLPFDPDRAAVCKFSLMQPEVS